MLCQLIEGNGACAEFGIGRILGPNPPRISKRYRRFCSVVLIDLALWALVTYIKIMKEPFAQKVTHVF